ncbi:MAG: sigma-70 family RNA polymerase sigma factor [Planctomycetaceae bacterium]|nr:sigma-70 family RNA polymerase sigma factor [Planctomycetaceae bacterium]
MALTDVDRDLCARCLTQDPVAWREFVDRFAGLFAHVVRHTAQARSVSLSASDVDDLVADMFLTVVVDDMAVLRRFKGRSSLATYLAVIGRRIAVREITQRRFAEALGHVPAHPQPAAPDSSRITNAELVEQMLAGLGEKEAAVVRGYHLDGQTYQQLSRSLGLPENSIGPMLSRARQKLRDSGLVVSS